MAKEEKPLAYERRVLDTKSLAQRIELLYFLRPSPFRRWKRRPVVWAPLVATAGIVPFFLPVGGEERAFSNGPVSKAHAIFEQDCSLCHSEPFSAVADQACLRCHDGPAHVSTDVGASGNLAEARCAACHVEHQGDALLAFVRDGNCTRCHEDLNAVGVRTTSVAASITLFHQDEHPDFPRPDKTDTRPLRLNHAVHMPGEPKKIRNIELPMQCSDCHETDRTSSTGDLLAVNFEKHCLSCHEQELQFDVLQLQGESARPAPHARDAAATRDFIEASYRDLLASRPSVVDTPIERGAEPQRNPEIWLANVTDRSSQFLFDRKCVYCHEYADRQDGVPQVKPVNPIAGRYVEGAPSGEAWFDHARFSHRAHRAVDCSSCHRDAAGSVETGDVLVPGITDCVPCHAGTGTTQDRCAQCHLYHDKTIEKDRDRRPIEQLLGRGSGLRDALFTGGF